MGRKAGEKDAPTRAKKPPKAADPLGLPSRICESFFFFIFFFFVKGCRDGGRGWGVLEVLGHRTGLIIKMCHKGGAEGADVVAR